MSVFAWPRGHSRRFRDDLLTAEPEFTSAEIGPGDDFLLMACDGVWDVLGKEEAVDHARKFFDEVRVRSAFRCNDDDDDDGARIFRGLSAMLLHLALRLPGLC